MTFVAAAAVALSAAGSAGVARATVGREGSPASTVVDEREPTAHTVAGTLAAAAPPGAAAPVSAEAAAAPVPTTVAADPDVAIGVPPAAPSRPAPPTTVPPVTVDPADVITRPTLPADVDPTPPVGPDRRGPGGAEVALAAPPVVEARLAATAAATFAPPVAVTLPETR